MDKDDQRTLEILTEIGNNETLTQNVLASRMGVAVGLANLYMKRVVKKGYVKISKLQGRRVKYLITPKGISEKSRLAYEFLTYSFQYYRHLREEIRERLHDYAAAGKSRVAFYGSGEPADLAYLSAKELGMSVVQVVDDEAKSERVADLPVEPVDALRTNECDVVLLLAGDKTEDPSERLIQIGLQPEQLVHVTSR